MNIGDYVRTKNGIGKIIKCNSIYFILDTDKDNIAHEQDEIVKSSPNIIDLIEENDYVNGHLVIKRHNDLMLEDTFDLVEDEDIKSIVTKEQFESMEYRIGE